MKYSFKLANKIRTKLLLFTDKEIRTQANNILPLNKEKDNHHPLWEIKTQEESFSNIQKDDVSNFNKTPYLYSSPKLLLNAYHIFQNQLKPNISSRFHSPNKIIKNSRNNDIFISNNKKYIYQSYKNKCSELLLTKVVNRKRKSKEYLKILCSNLINKSKLNKYYLSNLNVPKQPIIYEKSPKLKSSNKNIEKRKTVKHQHNKVNSFKIMLFACDY